MYWSWKPGHHTRHGGSTLRTLPKAKEIYSQQGCFRVHWGSRPATCIIGSSQFRSPVSNKNVRIARGMWHWLHSPDLTRLTTCLEEMPVQLAHHPKRQKAPSCWSTSRRHFSWYPRGCKRFMVRKHVAVSIRECTCRMIDRRVDKVGHGGTDSLWLATDVKQTPVLPLRNLGLRMFA